MSENRKHINPSSRLSEDPLELISATHIDWGKSKQEIWAELEKKMEETAPVKIRMLGTPWMRIAIAATFALLIGLTVIVQGYRKTISIPAGQHGSVMLPDQSRVQLNAQTTLSYKPLLWWISRNVRLNGEAFFEVTPGKKFAVISNPGKTIVLGTSFNIFARESDYRVVCITGKVKVIESHKNQEVIIKPGQQATLSVQGTLDVNAALNTVETISWIENKLSFTAVPLQQVIEEISRQYGVIIHVPEGLDYIYTGTFRKNSDVQRTLDMICKPFGLTYARNANDEYVITHGH